MLLPAGSGTVRAILSPAPACVASVVKVLKGSSQPNAGRPVISVIFVQTSTISSQVVGTLRLFSSKNVLL